MLKWRQSVSKQIDGKKKLHIDEYGNYTGGKAV